MSKSRPHRSVSASYWSFKHVLRFRRGACDGLSAAESAAANVGVTASLPRALTRDSRIHTNTNWATISIGLPGNVLEQQALLLFQRVPARVLSPTANELGESYVGAGLLDLALQVPECTATAARNTLSGIGVRSGPANPIDEASRLARRMGIAALNGLLAPYAVVLAPRYFQLLRKAGKAPNNHVIALSAIGNGLLAATAVVALLVSM